MSSIRALFIVATACGLVACAATGNDDEAAFIAPTPIDQFPMRTAAEPEGILLAPHDFGLSQNQAQSLSDLAQRWRASGEGAVLIESPADGGPDAAATAYAARDALQSFGVPKNAIAIAGYQADATPKAPIRVSFQGRKAHIDDCDRSFPDLTDSVSNRPAPNFGCALNSNFAAMIANPADIDRPRGTDPADAGRRQVVLEKYRAGEVTSSAPDEQAKAQVSQSVQ
jgi:pilus assembly protein CpaD